jgi:hypothetical protein
MFVRGVRSSIIPANGVVSSESNVLVVGCGTLTALLELLEGRLELGEGGLCFAPCAERRTDGEHPAR